MSPYFYPLAGFGAYAVVANVAGIGAGIGVVSSMASQWSQTSDSSTFGTDVTSNMDSKLSQTFVSTLTQPNAPILTGACVGGLAAIAAIMLLGAPSNIIHHAFRIGAVIGGLVAAAGTGSVVGITAGTIIGYSVERLGLLHLNRYQVS